MDFQNGHGEQPPAEFCRSLRALIDVETNVLCTNLLIKLVGVMVQRTSSLKYARSLFQGVFIKLKDKKYVQTALQTLDQFLNILKIQDVIDSDILPALNSKINDMRLEAANYISSLYKFDITENNVNENSIIKDTNLFRKLLV